MPGGTEETHEEPVTLVSVPVKIWTGLLNTGQIHYCLIQISCICHWNSIMKWSFTTLKIETELLIW